jgi:DNA-binding transcriptional LysR family regulator
MPRDLDLRKLRYFVALADELNFTRAAEALHIAQPVLSRQIRALEDELGASLFHRDSRGTTLTEAGARLAEDARPLLASSAELQRRIGLAAGRSRILTVGVMPGLLATSAILAFEAEHPRVTVSVRRVGWNDQIEGVRSGDLDVVYAREPFDPAELGTQALAEEPRVVVLPAADALADRSELSLGELIDRRLLQDPGAVPEWAELHRAAHRAVPKGGAVADTVEEKLELVASARGFVILPRSTSAFYRRPDIAIVPIADIGPSRVTLIWQAGSLDPERESFVRHAVTHGGDAFAG